MVFEVEKVAPSTSLAATNREEYLEGI